MEEKNFVSTAVHLLIVKQNFVPNVEKSINSEQNASVQKKVYQQTNFVMDMLRNFANPIQ